MNDVRRGYLRDSRIVAGIREMKALTTEQVRCLYFRGLRYGLRKAQERLLKLVREGRVKRTRAGPEYAYYVDRERPGQLDHVVAVNWCRIYLERSLLPQERLTWMQPDYGFLRPDGLALIENTLTGNVYGWYVEADLSDNRFDKAGLYARLYESGAYEGEWWVGKARVFPGVLVATHRPVAVQRAIKRDNAAGLQFVVKDWIVLRGEAGGRRTSGEEGIRAGSGDGSGRVHLRAGAEGFREAGDSGAGKASVHRPVSRGDGQGRVCRHRVGSGILRTAQQVPGEAHRGREPVGEVLGLRDQDAERG